MINHIYERDEMAAIKELLSTNSNGLSVKLFEYDINDEQGLNDVRQYLIDKIQSSKVHRKEEFDVSYYASKNQNQEFLDKLNSRIASINTPIKSKIPQFDVRRERVTEWMAQLLLEEKYNCVFHDEADKRMNIEPVAIDKHTPGVDVPGIKIVNDKMKFVICEVKASEEKKIPCSSVQALQDDIQKSIDNTENRVSKEILQYIHGIRNIKMQSDELQKILDFLRELLIDSDSALFESLLFFPILIRNNKDVIENKNVDDFNNFIVKGTVDIENIILGFDKSINEFSNDVYSEAIVNE